VDDYYGASRAGVELTGGVLLTLLAELVGRPTDPGKSEDGVLSMILLGARITVELELGLVKARIDQVKAKLWRHDLLQDSSGAEIGSRRCVKIRWAAFIFGHDCK